MKGITAVWLFLMLATGLLWWLGGEQVLADTGTRNTLLATGIVVVAFVKIRFVVMHFMEAKNAPLWLRFILEAWIVLTPALILAAYHLAGQG